MARRKKRKYKRNSLANDLFGRAIRALVAVLVLTAFVLGISLAVRQASALSSAELTDFLNPYLARFGLGGTEVGEVAGKLFKRVTDLGIEGVTNLKDSTDVSEDEEDGASNKESPSYPTEVIAPEGEVIFSYAIIADSHIANDKQEYKDNKAHLVGALEKAKELNVKKVIHVGDITNWGVLSDLREAKGILDDSELDYFALPGDRDLAQSVGPDNFLTVFGTNNFIVEEGNEKFVLLDNSANYTLISDETMNWFTEEVKDADFVILSQPLYTEGLALFNYLYMGSLDEDPGSESLAQRQLEVKGQRDKLLELIRNSKVKVVIAGDHHKSSQLLDGLRKNLLHHVAGAVSATVSEYAQSVLQSQRFSLLKVYENGGYVIEDVIL